MLTTRRSYASLRGDKISSLLPVKFMTHFVEIKKKLVASPFLLAVVIKCDIDKDVGRNLLFKIDYSRLICSICLNSFYVNDCKLYFQRFCRHYRSINIPIALLHNLKTNLWQDI